MFCQKWLYKAYDLKNTSCLLPVVFLEGIRVFFCLICMSMSHFSNKGIIECLAAPASDGWVLLLACSIESQSIKVQFRAWCCFQVICLKETQHRAKDNALLLLAKSNSGIINIGPFQNM
ncbi:hypothetical protein J6590_033179 [Homalodisca vitripennis]|nr:hypothetical protein J6590_033179 [Homalodisca vitripennis]